MSQARIKTKHAGGLQLLEVTVDHVITQDEVVAVKQALEVVSAEQGGEPFKGLIQVVVHGEEDGASPRIDHWQAAIQELELPVPVIVTGDNIEIRIVTPE